MRFQNWPLRLNRIITDCQHKPFAWGEHDCCLFAANVVLELTGVDHAADLRGSYATALSAARILEERGGVAAIATAALGESIPPLTAQRGDVVLIETEEYGASLGICNGDHHVTTGATGLTRVPLTAATAAWRVV